MARARIGIIGYFGYGNYGDELFIEVYRKFFYDCEVVVIQDSLDHPHYNEASFEKIKMLDAVVIGGGDLIIPKYFAQNYFLEECLQKPVYFHGVGVPLWIGQDQAVIDKMAAYMRHPNVKRINVRDVESADWVKAKIKPTAPVDYSADMVFALDFPRVARDPKAKVFGLVTRKLTPGMTRWDHITALCDRARSFGYTIHNIVLGTGRIRDDDLLGLQEFPYADMTTVDPNDLDGLTRAIGACDVIASTKFHGCVVATAYGIPAITLTTTDKFLSLYKMIERRDLVGHHIHDDVHERLAKFMAPIPRATRTMLREDAIKSLEALRHDLLGEIS